MLSSSARKADTSASAIGSASAESSVTRPLMITSGPSRKRRGCVPVTAEPASLPAGGPRFRWRSPAGSGGANSSTVRCAGAAGSSRPCRRPPCAKAVCWVARETHTSMRAPSIRRPFSSTTRPIICTSGRSEVSRLKTARWNSSSELNTQCGLGDHGSAHSGASMLQNSTQSSSSLGWQMVGRGWSASRKGAGSTSRAEQ